MKSLSAFLSRFILSPACLVALAVTASACEGQAGPAEGIFMAQTEEGVRIAVVAADDLVTVFACDGNYDYLGVYAWFHGRIDGGAGTLTNADGATVELAIDGDRFSASLRGENITLGPHDFSGAAVVDEKTGLFWGQVDGWVGGWIVDETGEQTGAAINRSTDDAALPFLEPGATEVVLDLGGIVMPVTRMTAPIEVE